MVSATGSARRRDGLGCHLDDSPRGVGRRGKGLGDRLTRDSAAGPGAASASSAAMGAEFAQRAFA